MPTFSATSEKKLATCNIQLVELFTEVVKLIDITILDGHRTKELQDLYYSQGKSKVEWPNGKHNALPALAVDVAPYPIDWSDRKKVRFYYLAGVVKDRAAVLGIPIRWGGNWDGDLDFFDQSFVDLPHFELSTRGPN